MRRADHTETVRSDRRLEEIFYEIHDQCPYECVFDNDDDDDDNDDDGHV